MLPPVLYVQIEYAFLIFFNIYIFVKRLFYPLPPLPPQLVETDLPKGLESLNYGKHYITFLNLHKSRGGMGECSDGNAEPRL